MIDISERIEELLEEKKLTKYQLAKKSDISLSTLSTLMIHKSSPRFETIYKLCNGFDVTVAYFFKETGSTDPNDLEEVKLAKQLQYVSERGREHAISTMKYIIENDHRS